MAVIHVEDLAEALARMVAPGPGPRRFMLGGDFLTWTELADLCDDLTGVRCRRLVVPGWVLSRSGALLDAAKRIKPFDYPLTRDAAEVMVSMVPTDDRATEAALGLERRPPRASIEEALRCLAADGHLAPEKAGRLAPPGAVSPSQPPTRRCAPGSPATSIHPMAGSALFARIGPHVVPYVDRFVHRITGGRVVTSQLFVDSLVLTTIGRKSGEPREAPLACAREAAGSWLVVGSNFGKEHHPAWTANLLANPEATRRLPRHRRAGDGAGCWRTPSATRPGPTCAASGPSTTATRTAPAGPSGSSGSPLRRLLGARSDALQAWRRRVGSAIGSARSCRTLSLYAPPAAIRALDGSGGMRCARGSPRPPSGLARSATAATRS